MAALVELQVSYAAKHPSQYVAIAIDENYLYDPVVVGMTVVKGLKKLDKVIEELDDDGA